MFYRAVLDSITAPVVVLDREWQVSYCNQAFADQFESPAESIMGAKLSELDPSFIGSPIYQACLKAMSSKETVKVEEKRKTHRVQHTVYPAPEGVLVISETLASPGRIIEELGQLARFTWVLDEVNDGLLLCDSAGIVIGANKRAAEMLSIARKELVGISWAELAGQDPPYTQGNARQWFTSVLRAGTPQSIEWQLKDRYGRNFHARIKAVPLGEGQVVLFLQDLGEIRMLTKRLSEMAELYSDLVDDSPDIIYRHDLKGHFLSVNPAAEKILGYYQDEFLSMDVFAIVDEESRELGAQYLNLAVDLAKKGKGRHKPLSYELALRAKDGRKVWLDVRSWLVYHYDEVFVQGIARDITASKMEEEYLRDMVDVLSDIIEWLPDPLLVIDKEGRVKIWNRAMESLTGVKAEEMLGKGNYAYAVPIYGTPRPLLIDFVTNPEQVRQYYKVVEQDQFTMIAEADTQSLKGARHYLWGKAVPLFDREGNIIGAMETIRDLTQHQQQIENLQAKIQELEAKIVGKAGE